MKSAGPAVAPAPEFDQYAGSYDAALAQGLSVSGEDKDYFAHGRVIWLAERLRTLNVAITTILDFGCGTGGSAPHLLKHFPKARYRGVDVSAASIEQARRNHGGERAAFDTLENHAPDGVIDLVFCNGVFHHIPPPQRSAALDCVRQSLRAGGLFALWENNPWNPGTRHVMSRIPFDRDAVTLSAPEGRNLLRWAGFEVLETRFLFIFPRALRGLRALEPLLSRCPLGAQYQILARKTGPWNTKSV